MHTSRASGLTFYTESVGSVTEKMRISSTGLVGIGTAATENMLEVMRAADSTAYSSVGDQRAKQVIKARMNCEVNGAFTGISMVVGSGNQSVWEMVNIWRENYIGDLAFKTRIGGSSFTEVMRMNGSDQRVGI